jgi:hypothetical protein
VKKPAAKKNARSKPRGKPLGDLTLSHKKSASAKGGVLPVDYYADARFATK